MKSSARTIAPLVARSMRSQPPSPGSIVEAAAGTTAADAVATGAVAARAVAEAAGVAEAVAVAVAVTVAVEVTAPEGSAEAAAVAEAVESESLPDTRGGWTAPTRATRARPTIAPGIAIRRQPAGPTPIGRRAVERCVIDRPE